MSLPIYNHRIIVFDHSNMGILCDSPSDEISAALVSGMVNGDWISISRTPKGESEILTYNYEDLNSNYQIVTKLETFSGKTVKPMDERLVTEEWIEKRRLILEKKKALTTYEWMTRISTSRFNDFYGWPYLLPFLTNELAQCDPALNSYTDAIKEYATFNEIELKYAFYELKRKVDRIYDYYKEN
jgi:hypothetical protein